MTRTHIIRIHNRQRETYHLVEVPEDQYILQTAEEQGVNLPFSCRNGACTACAVRVVSGELEQPEAMGLSPQLRQQGYALLCVSYPCSELQVETQDEDEVYELQFGRYFGKGKVVRGLPLDED
jgi:ferredoxin